MGLKDVLARREQVQQAREDRPFQILTIKDGDTAIIRFLDDDMYEERKFHTKVQTFPSGKKFTFQIPCADDCAYCDSPDDDLAKVKTKIMAWIYVSEVYHPNPDTEGKWVLKKRAGGKAVYVEKVDGIKLFLNSVGNKGALSEQILELYRENGTISDRLFSWGRKGSKQLDTTYTLVARDKSERFTGVKPPMTLAEVVNYLLKSATASLNFKKNGGGRQVIVEEEPSQEISEATQKALDDIISEESNDDESLF